MTTARKIFLSTFILIGLTTIIWALAHLGHGNAEAGEPKPLPTLKAEGLDGPLTPQKVIPITKCETVTWRQWVGDANRGTIFEITKLGVDGSAYLVFTSEHGVFVIKE
ncbi:MAG TPA: hypothetical protein VGY55_16400 [Pirellulales bacterium]|jgi:hypothetical protein|nr:hypothetical protein [Pirellulales bacterium]